MPIFSCAIWRNCITQMIICKKDEDHFEITTELKEIGCFVCNANAQELDYLVDNFAKHKIKLPTSVEFNEFPKWLLKAEESNLLQANPIANIG